MISWASFQTLLLLFGPFIYSKGKAFYYSTKSRGPPQPLSIAAYRLLNILFVTALIALASTLEVFSPENIFTKTGSRLQIPTDVLFSRLSKMRELTPQDEALRSRLDTKEGRLLYATYGPVPLTECNWCKLDDPNTFLFYALPNLVLPHLLHIAVLGAVTSSYFSPHGNVWRTQATIAGLWLLLAEIYMVGISTTDYALNTAAKTLEQVSWTHWRLLFLRGIGMALVDAFLGYTIFLTGTGRWTLGLGGLRVEERLETLSKAAETVYARLHTENYLRQTVLRDKDLRDKFSEFWVAEETAGKEVMLDEGVSNARSTLNLDVAKLTEEAAKKSEALLNMTASWRGLPQQFSSQPKASES